MRIYWSLYPLALMYGLAVHLRNKCFDWGILKQNRYTLPIICIGNLTVGGTGKTPHTEYLIRLLSRQGKVAVLSRGYKRQTQGFVLADAHTSMPDIGDEPYQMKQKFPDITVAVDANRREGIEKLMPLHPDVILLDDAYQHRYVKAGLNLLLTDYNRLMTRDHMLPAGRLREPLCGKRRADILIVTKCPATIPAIECDAIRKELKPLPHQQVFFSAFEYGLLQSIFQAQESCSVTDIQPHDQVLLLTGIANPEPLRQHLQKRTENIIPLEFPDHYTFSKKDLLNICTAYHALPQSGKRWIITTEKDATRLSALQDIDAEVARNIWALPIEVKILEGKEQEFNNRICKELK
mgnify:CR=1 FL=1